MRVLVIAASKGGVGKTTLAACLAVEAMRHHKSVAIMDLDPQQSLARWQYSRNDEQDSFEPYLIEPGKDLRRTIERAGKDKCDRLIIDTPSGSLTRMQVAIAVADMVLIPARPSPIDVESLDAVVRLCASHRRASAIVLNATTPGSAMTVGARNYLDARYGNVFSVEIPVREIYAGAMLQGSTPAELKPKGAEAAEIAMLWRMVDETDHRVAAVRPAQKSKWAG